MDGARAVVAAVRERLASRGSVPVEEVIELGLYHPSAGLYRIDCPARGRAGHFTTCPRIDPAIGEAIAAWLVDEHELALGAPRRWHAIEVGGGDGALAQTVLGALPAKLRAGLTYHMVEQGPRAESLARERLGSKASWAASMSDALRRARGEALVFSNELVDAFPPVALERRRGRWLETHLALRGEQLVEVLCEPGPWATRDGPLSLLALEGVPERARAEAHPSYHRWLRSWAPLWARGAMLTIDYGGSCEELYGRGGGGTLRAYYKSQRVDGRDGLYERLGLQDLTCDVNFTDLVAWGEGLGFETIGLWTQRDFVLGRGAVDPRPGLAFIASAGGAGFHYRVLAQRRAVTGPGSSSPRARRRAPCR